MSEAWSIKTFRPSNSYTLSMGLLWLSKFIWYENPEHPPPATPTRNPSGWGSCWDMISLTLETALEVISIGMEAPSAVGPRDISPPSPHLQSYQTMRRKSSVANSGHFCSSRPDL